MRGPTFLSLRGRALSQRKYALKSKTNPRKSAATARCEWGHMYLCYQSQRSVSVRTDTGIVTSVTRAWPNGDCTYTTQSSKSWQAHPNRKAGTSCKSEPG